MTKFCLGRLTSSFQSCLGNLNSASKLRGPPTLMLLLVGMKIYISYVLHKMLHYDMGASPIGRMNKRTTHKAKKYWPTNFVEWLIKVIFNYSVYNTPTFVNYLNGYRVANCLNADTVIHKRAVYTCFGKPLSIEMRAQVITAYLVASSMKSLWRHSFLICKTIF